MIEKTIRTTITGFALLLVAVSASAQISVQATYSHIVAAPYFSVGGTGGAGRPSQAEIGLWALLDHKDEAKLIALTQEKNATAKLYGLLGLRYLNNAQYIAIAQSLSKSTVQVNVMSGCMGSKEKVSTIATKIAMGKYNERLKYDMKQRIKRRGGQ